MMTENFFIFQKSFLLFQNIFLEVHFGREFFDVLVVGERLGSVAPGKDDAAAVHKVLQHLFRERTIGVLLDEVADAVGHDEIIKVTEQSLIDFCRHYIVKIDVRVTFQIKHGLDHIMSVDSHGIDPDTQRTAVLFGGE